MTRRFRSLLGITTATTFVLILLGLHTGNTAGGLSCATRWPFCNGWLGLFPANWADFFEWFHRFVAMVDGFLLLGTLYGAWRLQDDRRIRWAVTGAIVLLPAQIVLGAVTTTAGGAFAGGFNPVVILTHFSTATVIFAAIVYATARAYGVPTLARFRRLAAGTVGLVAAGGLFEYLEPFAYPPANDVGYYAATFALVALLVALSVWSRAAVARADLLRFRAVAAAAALTLYVDMVLSRELFLLPETFGRVATLGLAVLAAGVAVTAARYAPDAPRAHAQRAD